MQQQGIPGASGPAVGVRTVLFDFDGVILRGDAFAEFVRARFRGARWRWVLALLLILPLLPAWPFTRRRITKTCVFVALAGLSEGRYRAAAQTFGGELARQPRRFHREALSCLRTHLANGDTVMVVTGCEETLVRSIFEALGLPGLPIVASRLAPGRLGMRVVLHNIGRRKVESLATAGVLPAWDVAYGDSVHDLPMLREAREAVLVNATPAWCKRVEQLLGRTVTRAYWY